MLEPIVSEILKTDRGVTRADVLNRVRQTLWESGIKPDRPRYNSHFLDVDLVMHSKGTNFSVEVSLKKMAQAYGYDPRKVGTVIKLPQGRYGVFGNAHKDKGYVLDAVEEVLRGLYCRLQGLQFILRIFLIGISFKFVPDGLPNFFSGKIEHGHNYKDAQEYQRKFVPTVSRFSIKFEV